MPANSSLPQIQQNSILVPTILVLGSLCVLFGPVFGLRALSGPGVQLDAVDGAATATVALGAVFRSNGRNILRSSFMSAFRTAFRTATRRIVRSLLPTVLRLFLPLFRTTTSRTPDPSEKSQPLPVALGLGFVTLWLSFFGVVALGVSDPEGMLSGLSVATAAMLAASALVFHFGYLFLWGQKLSVEVSLNTPPDGILLQAYFTGALSYLPLASDITLRGEDAQRSACSSLCLSSMLVTGLAFILAGQLAGIPLIEIWGTQLLLYAFVISFPLHPLEGSNIWRHSKAQWAAVFVAVFASFMLNMPERFYGVL